MYNVHASILIYQKKVDPTGAWGEGKVLGEHQENSEFDK